MSETIEETNVKFPNCLELPRAQADANGKGFIDTPAKPVTHVRDSLMTCDHRETIDSVEHGDDELRNDIDVMMEDFLAFKDVFMSNTRMAGEKAKPYRFPIMSDELLLDQEQDDFVHNVAPCLNLEGCTLHLL